MKLSRLHSRFGREISCRLPGDSYYPSFEKINRIGERKVPLRFAKLILANVMCFIVIAPCAPQYPINAPLIPCYYLHSVIGMKEAQSEVKKQSGVVMINAIGKKNLNDAFSG